MSLQALINKVDNFEIIRDQIASILVGEISNQKALAIAATLDPKDWDLRIYKERSNAWEQWLTVTDDTITTPIVNVAFDISNVDAAATTQHHKQKFEGIFNIDCFGLGISSDDPLGGHMTGDQSAVLEVHRAARLVRNIIRAGENTYLQMRGIVGGREIQSITSFRPETIDGPVEKIAAARLQLKVAFNEFTDQYVGELLEMISIDVFAKEDGELLLELEYQYP